MDMRIDIHPTSVVDREAILGAGTTIGPNCYVGPKVVLGERCRLHNNVTIIGRTRAGADNEFYPCSVIGGAPQDLKYAGGDTEVIIGDGNVFRECVTVHTGTEIAGGVTRIGDHNRFLVSSHIAHDATIGSHCILANHVQLAGHVVIEDRVTMGGIVGVHHFVTIGRYAYVAGMSRVTVDVPPFMTSAGYPTRVRGVNTEGMKRWGISEERIGRLKDAYRALFSRRATAGGGPILEKIAAIESNGPDDDVRYLCEFIKRGLQDGVYGRYLESQRPDPREHRKHFYAAAGNNGGPENAS